MTVVAISPKRIPEVWPRVLYDIERAIRRTKIDLFDAEDVRLACIRGQSVMFIAFHEEGQDETKVERIDGVAIAKIDDFPRMRVCNVPIVGGRNLALWKADMLDALKRFAKEFGAVRLMGGGRTGWMRAAGFSDGGRTLVMELD